MATLKPNQARQLFALSLSALIAASTCLLNASEASARHRRSGRGGHTSPRHSAAAEESDNKHGRHHGRHHAAPAASKTRYAYPLDFFMMSPPEFDRSDLPAELSQRARNAFESGTAVNYAPSYLVRAGVFHYHPLHGGIFKRREEVKYIIIHSTESGVPQNAYHCIDGWNSMGRRHPGAQFVVDRDGAIWEACDPELATVHVNIFKTLPGINNDNTIGIEMCHAGSQTYPPEQRNSVTRLVSYLQDRYHVLNENIITHRYAQQGDHTDPVGFDWDGFLAHESSFHNRALAMRRDMGPATADEMAEGAEVPTASVYLEMHKTLKIEDVLNRPPIPNSAQLLNDQVTATKTAAGSSPNGLIADPNRSGGAAPNSLVGGGPRRPAIRGEIELPPDSAAGAGKVPADN